MNKITLIRNGNQYLHLNALNGNHILCTSSDIDDVLKHNKSFRDWWNTPIKKLKEINHNFETVYISIHASNTCNLSCKYCFRGKRVRERLSYEECVSFIDYIVKTHSSAKKYVVDLTGSGEPILNLNIILELSEYCKNKSNEILKEITVMIATNGTLLTEDIVDKLQDNGIIFGVSIDGGKSSQPSLRVDKYGKSVRKQVIKNVRRIKEKGFLGAAYTVTGCSRDLLKDLKYLYNLFPTISMKPVRSNDPDVGISDKNIENIKVQYKEMYNFLLDEALKGNLSYIYALLDGEDYFGKYIYRVLMNKRVLTRCDAGVARYSLSNDRNIYVCPAADGMSELVIGSIKSKVEINGNIDDVLLDNSQCSDCYAKYYCGGVCQVESIVMHNELNKNSKATCEYNRYLVLLAMLLVNNIKIQQPLVFESLRNFCINKNSRNITNPDIIRVAKEYCDSYSFTDVMKMEFEQKEEFKSLLEALDN